MGSRTPAAARARLRCRRLPLGAPARHVVLSSFTCRILGARPSPAPRPAALHPNAWDDCTDVLPTSQVFRKAGSEYLLASLTAGPPSSPETRAARSAHTRAHTRAHAHVYLTLPLLAIPSSIPRAPTPAANIIHHPSGPASPGVHRRVCLSTWSRSLGTRLGLCPVLGMKQFCPSRDLSLEEERTLEPAPGALGPQKTGSWLL